MRIESGVEPEEEAAFVADVRFLCAAVHCLIVYDALYRL